MLLLKLSTLTALNTRQVFELVFTCCHNALRAYLYLWQFETQFYERDT